MTSQVVGIHSNYLLVADWLESQEPRIELSDILGVQ